MAFISRTTQGLPHLPAPSTEAPIIAIVLPSPNPLELVECLVPHLSDYRVLLYVNGMNPTLEARVRALGLFYTTDFDFFLMQAPNVSLVLTFGALPHPAHIHVNLAVSLFNDLKIPVMDIQHGLFQWGVCFSDTSLRQGSDFESGCSLPMNTVADVQVTWAGPDGIGYPRCAEATTQQETSLKNDTIQPYILLATNTNWHIYHEEERHRLKLILREAFLDFPDIHFVWKAHPAENSPTLMSVHSLIEEVRDDFPNVEIARSVAEGGKSLTELIQHCHAGICTVGTSLIDFELFGKPCLCFETHAVKKLISSLPQIETFSSRYELKAKLSTVVTSGVVPKTGQMLSFRPDKLIAKIASHARQTRHPSPLSASLRAVALAKQLLP